MVKDITITADLAAEIANSSHQQSTGLSEINIGVSQLDAVTQQNAAMVEEATAAGHMLNSDARNLADVVARFNTGESPAARTGVRGVTSNSEDWSGGTMVQHRVASQ